MDDYEALLNRVSKQLAHSSFASQRQPKSSTRHLHQSGGASRIHKPSSGRNSPASRHNHRVPIPVEHLTLPAGVQQFRESERSLADLNFLTPEPGRPHSWHQSAFLSADYSDNLVSSSYPDSSFVWPLAQPWNVNGSEEASPQTWSAPSGLAEMSQGPPPDNMYAHYSFGPPSDVFESFADSERQPALDLGPDLPLPQAMFGNDYIGAIIETPITFDGFYGPTAQSIPKLGSPRLSFDSIRMPEGPTEANYLQQDPVDPLAFQSQAGVSNDEELIGLGLYDKAEDTERQNQQLNRQGPTLLFGDFVQSGGKGLKLEETWQPPSVARAALNAYAGEVPVGEVDDYGDEAGYSSNDDEEEYEKHDDEFYGQQLISPIDIVGFSSFPLPQSGEQFLFGDVAGFADELMESRQKILLGQGDYDRGWFE